MTVYNLINFNWLSKLIRRISNRIQTVVLKLFTQIKICLRRKDLNTFKYVLNNDDGSFNTKRFNFDKKYKEYFIKSKMPSYITKYHSKEQLSGRFADL